MFIKGYKYDAGVDVILQDTVVFRSHEIKIVDLGIQVTPGIGECAMLCARTSAAAKGLYVAMCPIDTDYTGNVHAIVYNFNDENVKYEKGEAFCQVVGIKLADVIPNVTCKKQGRRSTSNFGGTDRGSNTSKGS